MGQRVAQRLLKAEHRVTVWNRSKDKASSLLAEGASWADSPRECGAGKDFVFLCLTDDRASREVWLDDSEGLLLDLEESTVCVELSTLSASWTEELSTRLGPGFLAAPMVGSRPHAEAGGLCLLIGGSSRLKSQTKELFSAFSAKQLWVGEPATAAILKLLVNGLFAVQVAAWAELLAAGQQQGVPGSQVLQVLGDLPVSSPAALAAGNQIVEQKFAPLFPIDLVEKDLAYLLQLRSENGLLAQTRALFQKAQSVGDGGLNITGVARVVESSAQLQSSK